MLSKLAYIKDERRNSLDGEHLNACYMLAMQRVWDVDKFPYSKAMLFKVNCRSVIMAAAGPWPKFSWGATHISAQST